MASLGDLLVDAARSGNVVALDGLLQEGDGGAHVNLQTEGGVSLIMHAIIEAGQATQRGGRQEHLSVVQVLIQAGCDLSLVDQQYGRSAAHWAAFYHREDIFTELIIAGADLTLPDFSGVSPFLLAVQENATQCVAVAMNYCPKEMLESVDQEGRSPLLYAIHSGSVEMCRQLLELGASAETPDQITGRTPLHWASLYGRREVVELFCQRGCDVTVLDAEGRSAVHLAASSATTDALQALNKAFGNSILEMTDAGGLTPLMYACTSNSEESIKYLLKKKVNVHAQDNDGKSCLHWVVETASPEAIICIKLLCKRFPDLMRCVDHAGRTPLLWSCAQGTAPNLATLLELGNDFTALDSTDHSGLHWATVSGNPECVLLLLQAGSSPSSPDNQGAHPLHYAAQSARDAAPPLASSSFSDTIQAASSQGILECLQLLLEAGAEVDCRDQEGSTPLHWALQAPNNFTALSYLINAGADANAQNFAGLTSLHFAARHGHTENCQLLIEGVGGVALQPDGEGQTALFHAVEGGHAECVEYLLTIGATAGQLNNEKRSPVHVAASVGSMECLQVLASHGADLEQRSVHGAQPLHEAAASGQTECLEYLLRAGCGVHSRVSGGTALHYAASGGHTQCAQLLIEAGVDINALVGTEEFEYVTALDYAEASGNEELIQLIRSRGGRSGDVVLAKATRTLQYHLKQFVRSKRKHPATEGRASVKKRGEGAVPSGLSPAGLTTKQAAKDKVELLEAATEKEKGEEKEMEGEEEKGTTTKEVEIKSAAVPALMDKTPTTPITEDRQAVDEPAPSPTSFSKEQPNMSAKFLPRRLSQELPGDLFEVDRPLSRPPSRASFPSRPVSGARPSRPVPPQRPGTEDTSERRPSVLQRVLSVFHREPHPSPLVDSAVALYGATALILAGSAVGTALGEKAIEVGEKVARKEGEGLTGQGGSGRELPELLWEEIAEEPTPITTPSVTPPVTPTPPPPEIEEDPLERRMRKAKAQLALGHSAAFNAVNELAKAQSSGAKLKREFHLKCLQDHLEEVRTGYHKQEMKAAEESLKILNRHRQRMQQSQAASEVVNHAIGEVLSAAKDQNRQLDQSVFEMGYSRRPTVAQWLEQKKMQKQRELQEDMIQWDRWGRGGGEEGGGEGGSGGGAKREAALSVTQAVTTKRAYQHLAWAKGKDLRGRIRRLKEEEELIKAFTVLEPYSDFEKRLRTSKKGTSPVTFPKPSSAGRTAAPVGVRRLGAARRRQHSCTPAETSHGDVYMTPQGFAKTPSATPHRVRSRSQPFGEEGLWSYGEDVARGKQIPTVSSLKRLHRPEYIRATGPKESPRNRSLVFVHPSQYQPSRRGRTKVHPTSAQSSTKSLSESSLHIHSVEWSRPLTPRERGTQSPSGTAQYHGLAGDRRLGQNTRRGPRQKAKTAPPVKVLPMKILDSPQRTQVVTT